ncbi:uncharacterized protein BDZ83DRAFT_423461 [Colletotrichum acutatum]|uniref:Uncharacterized protein n=1 Tax=Glomerella acutata TaxID=27357 RepID=A0AAD8XML4_GLOAC|nr:uncharacterized protein BDZ83DRAFT_423461 [Colletotrichum acutatum]KAK1730114.1 hypothetical protein BDZ83DRAFT_423461 [Colletotrichum acutatum]
MLNSRTEAFELAKGLIPLTFDNVMFRVPNFFNCRGIDTDSIYNSKRLQYVQLKQQHSFLQYSHSHMLPFARSHQVYRLDIWQYLTIHPLDISSVDLAPSSCHPKTVPSTSISYKVYHAFRPLSQTPQHGFDLASRVRQLRQKIFKPAQFWTSSSTPIHPKPLVGFCLAVLPFHCNSRLDRRRRSPISIHAPRLRSSSLGLYLK